MDTVLNYIAAAVSVALAAAIVARNRRSFAHISLSAGLLLLACVEALPGWREPFFAFAPGAFTLFSLSFARSEYRRYLRSWKYAVAAVFTLPILALVTRGPHKVFYGFILTAAVFILANLERTLRASTGYIRWQIKFIIIGTACICASWVYIGSQALLYPELPPTLTVVQSVMVLLAAVFYVPGLLRSQYLKVDVYLSRATIQYSLTVLLVAAYLVIVGLLAYLVRYYNLNRLLPLDALLILIALALLAALLLSDRLQERLRRLVTRHFKRPLYDYRQTWMLLTESTNSLIDIHDLCTAVARIVSKTLGILSVSIWLCNESKDRLTLAGSTVFTPAHEKDLERGGDSVVNLLRMLERDKAPLDLRQKRSEWAEEIMSAEPSYFSEYRMRTIVPLQTGGRLVGIMTLNEDRVGLAPLSIEDHDLLNAYAAHLAARVLQLKLSEDLRKAQEIEAFQHVTAFFVHDLKNVASRLSLTMQNLPTYFNNPEFREDALRLIKESVASIDDTIARLSSLRKIEIMPSPTNLASLLQTVIKDFETAANLQVDKALSPLPEIPLDAEQIQKVVLNLLMNARDAIGGSGKIRVETTMGEGHVVIAVSDNGCGMSREFVEKNLFRPFSSTKKRGMGIGLFHCKMIVEAHRGKIEVDSRQGEGTTFRVLLPS